MSKKKTRKSRGGVGDVRKSLAAERANAKPRKPAAPRGAKRGHAGSIREDTARPQTLGSTADRNRHAEHNQDAYQLEGSNPARRPSRKSTRGSTNRIKPDANLRRRATRKTRSSKNRASMRSG